MRNADRQAEQLSRSHRCCARSWNPAWSPIQDLQCGPKRRRHSAARCGATSCRRRDGNHSPFNTQVELTNSYRPPGLEGIGCLPGRDQQDARFTSILKRKLVSLLETQINSCVREAATVLARLGSLVAPIAPRGLASGGADQPSLADLSCEMGMRWRGGRVRRRALKDFGG